MPPNVLQPYWFIVLPLDVPTLTTSLLYEILAARGGVIYIYRPYFWKLKISPLIVFERSYQPKVELHGREMTDEFLPENARLPYTLYYSVTVIVA
jgi:hypothetical protein